MLHIAQNIRLIRLLSGLTQKDFAERMGANRDRQYTYEAGKAVPDELYQSRVAKFANISLEDLQYKQLTEAKIRVIDPDTKEMVYTLESPANGQEQAPGADLVKTIADQAATIKNLSEVILSMVAKSEA